MFNKIAKLLITIVLSFGIQKHYPQIICNGKKIILTDDGRCNLNPYIMVFEDNFDGNSLDTSKWTPAKGVIRDFKHTIARQWFTPNNIEVSDGTLKLITKRDTLINQCFYNGTTTACEDFYFTAAQIDSKEKFEHGMFEISCKIAKGKGVASSFWTYGAEMNEIDVFEFENENDVFNKFNAEKSPKVHNMNSHTDYDGDGHTEDCPSNYKGPDFSQSFHVFTLIWTPHKLEWYVDGQRKRLSTLFYTMLGQATSCDELKTLNEYILNKAFPMNAMNIIVDNIIQSGNKSPDKKTAFPCYYEIDYIRYYRQ